jgi:hypothetical protein
VIFDRSRYYWIALGAAAAVFAMTYFGVPRLTPDQRVREQLAILSTEPWIRVRVEDVRYAGDSQPEEALLRGVRLDTGAPVAIDFTVSSPYTAAGAMKQLLQQALPGGIAEVLIVPRSLVREPYRARLQPAATHVGIAVFAGLPGQPDTTAEGTVPAPAPAATAAAETSTDG